MSIEILPRIKDHYANILIQADPRGIIMLPRQTIERYLLEGTRFPVPRELQDILWELRNLISAVAPAATEALHPYGITYYDSARGGPVSGGICQIGICKDHIRLGFVHGAFLPDPDGLLVGETRYKRYVPIDSYEAAPWDVLNELIQASAEFDPWKVVGENSLSQCSSGTA
jgi:hypothetical protein